MSAAYGTKTYCREDLQIIRSLVRDAEKAIASGDWYELESISRDIEARGSSLACLAAEKDEQSQNISSSTSSSQTSSARRAARAC